MNATLYEIYISGSRFFKFKQLHEFVLLITFVIESEPRRELHKYNP